MDFYKIKKTLDHLNDHRGSNFEWNHLFNARREVQISDHIRLFSLVSPEFQEDVESLGKFKMILCDENDRDGYGEIKIFYIYHFIDHNVYMKVYGTWSSYGGETFERCEEVRPVTKTITVYE